MTPSNANTSGLEVVAWTNEEYLADTRARKHGAYWMWGNPASEASVGLVTVASAQARIADLEARVEYLRGSRDGHAAHTHSEFEARVAAEARADRLAKALERIAHEKGVSNVAIARAALQQEG